METGHGLHVLVVWTILDEVGAVERDWVDSDEPLRLGVASSNHTGDELVLEVGPTTAAALVGTTEVFPNHAAAAVVLPSVMGTEIFHASGRQLLQLLLQLVG